MSNRQIKKQEQRMRAQAEKMSEMIQFRAVDMLNAIKDTWSDEEKDALIRWIKDPEAGEWGAK